MDSVEANSGFSIDSYEMVNRLVYYSNNSQKLPIRNAPNSRLRNNQYLENRHNGENVDVKGEVLEDEKVHKDGIGEDEEYGEDEVLGIKGDCKDKTQNNVIVLPDKHVDNADDEDDSNDDFDDNDDNDDDDDDDDWQNDNGGITNDAESRTKKRKLKSLALSYEFAPRIPPPPPEMAPPPGVPRLSAGSRNSQTAWTERESFVLLEAWGDRFLQHRKRSLRAEEWKEVAERVSDSETSRANRTESQCRNRLDTLKKKYKKEKSGLAEMGGSSKWVYFTKMDMLMSSPTTSGLDLGEYVFANPRVYLMRSDGMDEIRDSSRNSESSQKEEEEDSDGLPPKKRKSRRESRGNFRLLACSFKKFRKTYEKMENRQTQLMIELEKMRMQFQQDLEAERLQITESAHAEIARIRLGNGHDTSVDNAIS